MLTTLLPPPESVCQHLSPRPSQYSQYEYGDSHFKTTRAAERQWPNALGTYHAPSFGM